MSIITELKRRNVIRVGIAYLIVAWLLLQVVDVILNNIQAPGWVFQATLTLLGAGFVIVLVFSWVFELTPDGIRRESEIDRSTSITPVTARKLDRLITGVLVLALGYFVIDKFVLSEGRDAALIEAALNEAGVQAEAAASPPEPAREAPAEKSIAVLPFVNMSDDAGNEYFSDGVSEEILNALAKVRELKVAGRTSSFAFKGQNQDLRVIGEALGVQHILEGSVRKAGDKVRITAQLVKVDDGFHLWSETYDRELTDIFTIQDEIANAILVELKTALLQGESTLVEVATVNTEAYDLYLMARQRMYERTKVTLESAAELLDRAIAIAPGYAAAHAQRGIAALLLSETSYGDIPQASAREQARAFLDRALELDENLAEAWAGLGLYYNGPPREPRKGVEVLEHALALNPNLINAGNWLTLNYWGTNRASEALALLEQMTERDPLYKPAFGNRVAMLMWMNRIQEARDYIASVEPFMLDEVQLDQTRAWLEGAEGHHAAALRLMKKGLEKQPTDRVLRVGVNRALLQTHQFSEVTDDHFSDHIVSALFNLGRNEEALIIARERAATGQVAPLFALLNALEHSGQLVAYLEHRWPDLDAFQWDLPPAVQGYREMADIALAYRRTGDEEAFRDALSRLNAANHESLAQGVDHAELNAVVAAQYVLAGETDAALVNLEKAIEQGFVSSARISREWPYFRELEGNPKYEAIQAKMVENINRERGLLGLGPI